MEFFHKRWGSDKRREPVAATGKEGEKTFVKYDGT